MKRLAILAAITMLLAAAIAPAVAIAYDAAPSILHPTEPPAQQSGQSELPWLFAVYTITWAAFFAYVFIMSRRQREMEREIDALKRALNAKMNTQDN